MTIAKETAGVTGFKMGADPELFMRATTAGKPWVSAFNLVPGTKKEPEPVPGGAVQHDGMAAEYNIEPASSAAQFVANNKKVLIELSKLVPDYELVNRPCVTFSKSVWDSTVKEEKELGCEPDLNAYTREENKPPNGKVDFRTGSGHIHIGWTEGMDIKDVGHREAANMLIKELDIYVGLGLAWIDSSEAAKKRRNLYGKAGAYRVKPYGVEYRTPPNSWVGNDVLTAWIFNNAKLAFDNLMKGKSLAGKINARDLIDNPEADLGNIPYLLKSNSIPLPDIK